MRLYTKTGDKGRTSLIGGRREKHDIRVEAYGTCDELNGFVGRAISLMDEKTFPDIKPELINIQHELFDCGSDLSNIRENQEYKVTEKMITFLEERMDEYIQEAPKLERFILPGGTPVASELHICRTVCRRAERRCSELMQQEDINVHVFKYLNRLSDYFFAVARVANHREKVKDVEYERSAIVFRSRKDKK
ncbi:cob(I)yrinic acid a,c-diamide adenosyltransferase [Aliibacillus thermotolerans]|uniref:Corrinoid adenosyltransferase n=1 Tax=Aliibacillus thermotolerans TaxID=1834418 RepID=A0ABW0U891_9BACI|nr:cob(I)yrinic acid a,c-diamide adenosyltransferase [Aliibacillus thermotolerans]MDA3128667.1 cob(I)yrinic acid a,c-diamide adenosyltransferase [Aliibacillus thermotolerans]